MMNLVRSLRRRGQDDGFLLEQFVLACRDDSLVGNAVKTNPIPSISSQWVGRISFAIHQPVTQISLPMPVEEMPTGILGRSYRPFVSSPIVFPNLSFNLFDDFMTVDWYGCGLSPEL
jgi:hypothetical protein